MDSRFRGSDGFEAGNPGCGSGRLGQPGGVEAGAVGEGGDRAQPLLGEHLERVAAAFDHPLYGEPAQHPVDVNRGEAGGVADILLGERQLHRPIVGEPEQPPIYLGMGSGDAYGGLMAALAILRDRRLRLPEEQPAPGSAAGTRATSAPPPRPP
mgnify:CR=1 FL=1